MGEVTAFPEPDASGLARRLYRHLTGVDLKTAEEAIEDARKVAWVADFSGAPTSACCELYARSTLARRLTAELSGLALMAIEAILQELRLNLYMNAFGADPRSRFGMLMREAVPAIAEAERPEGETRH